MVIARHTAVTSIRRTDFGLAILMIVLLIGAAAKQFVRSTTQPDANDIVVVLGEAEPSGQSR